MNTISLDFETLYESKEKNKENPLSVKNQGNWAYTHDPRFEAYLISAYDGGQSWVGHPRDFNWDALEGALLLANNASFERSVCRALGEQGKAPVLVNPWQCVANMTTFICGCRALDDSMEVLEGVKIDKGLRAYMNGRTFEDAVKEGKAEALKKYCRDDAAYTHMLWTKYNHLWPENEREISELTMRQCARGIAVNTALLSEYIATLEEVIFNLVQSFPWVERGEKPSSAKAIAEQCRLTGIPAPPVKTHDEEGFDLWLKTWGPKYQWCYGAGQWRQLSKLLSSLKTVRGRIRPDNTMDFSLLYFGANQTGRWSGGGSSFNLQNLRKIPLFLKDKNLVEPPAGLKSKEFKQWTAANTDYALDIRRLLVARPGKKFICADLSQIEPRCLAWLTGNTELLDLIRDGFPIYEAFARSAMGWTGTKGKMKYEDEYNYQLAKIQVLGLGYGCGAEKFIDIAAGYDVSLTLEESEALVKKFREQNPKITKLWRKLDHALQCSVNRDYEIELPSGRVMTYRNVKRSIKTKFNTKTGKNEQRMVWTAKVGNHREELYGGILTENLTQATAREVFARQLPILEKEIGDQIFHVHDEAITEVDLDVKPADVEEIMSRTPEWLEGCPLGAEAKESPHYFK